MRPHDLLRLTADASVIADDVPAWVAVALRRAPFVVVRRGHAVNDAIPVGVRGASRDQRFAAMLKRRDVAAVVTPEEIAAQRRWTTTPRAAQPVFAAMAEVDRAASGQALTWGPGGSAGFELASAVPTVGANSDLDVIVRPQPRHGAEELRAFRHALAGLAVCVDVVIETARGGVALDEWLAAPQHVLIKTADGPRLGAFAW